MSTLNRIANADNRFQGDTKRVLCVCSAGLLRSPTAAVVLSQEPYNYNTRAAGVSQEYALIPVDVVLLSWADEIVCMGSEHVEPIKAMLEPMGKNVPIKCLNIPDSYAYRDPELIELIRTRYEEAQ